MSTETKQPLDIEAIRAREAAATKGPWIVEASGDVDFKFYVCAPWPDAPELGPEHAIGGMREHADALFTVYAREDIPALIERVAELERAISLHWFRDHHDSDFHTTCTECVFCQAFIYTSQLPLHASVADALDAVPHQDWCIVNSIYRKQSDERQG